MAKSASVVEVKDQITSLKDGAYKQAVATDRMRSVARFVMAQSKAFPESVAEEIKEQLYEGYRLRFNEVNKPETYAVVNDHYILIDGSNPDLEAKEKVVIGVDYCYAYSQQQYGKLKNENPNLHAVIKGWRDRTSSYCSNRLADLKRQARTIMNEGKTRDRAATIDFAQRITETFKGDQGLIVKCKNAFARGDATANEARLKTAIDAFMVKWNA
jgi:DNA-binding transcriptional regulator YbjK